MKKVWLFLILCFLFISCDKKLVTELKCVKYYDSWDRDTTYFIYDDKELYDGEAWSRDKKSYKITVKRGRLQEIEYYDKDGDVFCREDSDGRESYYSKKGDSLLEEVFKELYSNEYALKRRLEKELASTGIIPLSVFR